MESPIRKIKKKKIMSRMSKKVSPTNFFSMHRLLNKAASSPKDSSQLREMLKRVFLEFDQKASKSYYSDYPIDQFVVLVRFPVVLGISSDGYLVIIYLNEMSFQNIKVAAHLNHIVVDPEETLAYITDQNSTLHILEIPSGNKIASVQKLPKEIESLKFVPPNLLKICSKSADIYTFEWDGITLKEIYNVKCPVQEPCESRISEDGLMILTKNEKQLCLFDDKGQKLFELFQDFSFSHACFSPRSTYLAVTIKTTKKKTSRYQIHLLFANDPSSVKLKIQITEEELKSIQDLYFSRDENFLLATKRSGDVKIWEISEQGRVVVLPIHSEPVSFLVNNLADNKIYSSDKNDHSFTISSFPEFPQNIRIPSKDCTAYLELRSTNRAFFLSDTHKTEVNLTNYYAKQSAILENQRIEAAIYSEKRTVVFLGVYSNNKYSIVEWNPDTNEEQQVITELEEKTLSLELSSDESYLFVGGKYQKILVFSTFDWKKIRELAGHRGEVGTLLYLSIPGCLVSGSADDTAKVWFESNDYQTFINFIGHTDSVVKLAPSVDKEILITASKDKSIGLWSLKDFALIIFLKGHTQSVSSISPTRDGKYLYSIDEGSNLKLWSLESFDCIFTETYKGFREFLLPASEEKIILIGSKDLLVIDNPMDAKTIGVAGVTQKQQFIQYISDILSANGIPEHNPELDKGVITPYILTPLHLFAYLNIPKYLKQSLELKSPILFSSFGETPLSISVNRAFKECIKVMIKSFKSQIETNPYSMSCVTADVLISLNKTEFPGLFKLYNLLLHKSNNQFLSQFIDPGISTPLYKKSSHLSVSQKDFSLENTDEGKAVMYLESLVKFNYMSGSSDSLNFLRSLIRTKNQDIFKTEFVQVYLDYKWQRLKYFLQIQAVIYAMFIASVILLVFIDSGDVDVDMEAYLAFPFMLNVFLSAYEIFQFTIAFKIYLEAFWNYIDLARSIFVFLFAIKVWFNISEISNEGLLVALCSFTLARGISYFRLFRKTRYMVNLLIEVIKDLTAFLTLLAYTTISFGILYYIVFDLEDDEPEHYFGAAYVLNLGEFDVSGYTMLQWIIFFFSSALNPIIMLNLLIAIMGDTYDRVQESVEVADNKELAEMILEAEVLLFCRRESREFEYLKICTDNEEKKKDFLWQGRIRAIKGALKKLRRNVNTNNEKLGREVESIKDQTKLIYEDIRRLATQTEANAKNLDTLVDKSKTPEERQREREESRLREAELDSDEDLEESKENLNIN